MGDGRRYVRVVALDDGRWACRQGRLDLGTHGSLDEAIAHARVVAAQVRPAEVMVHATDGTVRSLVTID